VFEERLKPRSGHSGRRFLTGARVGIQLYENMAQSKGLSVGMRHGELLSRLLVKLTTSRSKTGSKSNQGVKAELGKEYSYDTTNPRVQITQQNATVLPAGPPLTESTRVSPPPSLLGLVAR